MKIVKRKGTTKAKVMPANSDKLKAQFLSDIWIIVSMEDIPAELSYSVKLEVRPHIKLDIQGKGIKRIEIADLDDKRATTILLSFSMNGQLLPMQVICTGKTPTCLPKVPYP